MFNFDTAFKKKNKGSKPNKFQVNRAELHLMRAGLPEIWHLRQMGSPPVWTCNIFADLMKTVNQPWTVSVCLLCQCCSKQTLPYITYDIQGNVCNHLSAVKGLCLSVCVSTFLFAPLSGAAALWLCTSSLCAAEMVNFISYKAPENQLKVNDLCNTKLYVFISVIVCFLLFFPFWCNNANLKTDKKLFIFRQSILEKMFTRQTQGVQLIVHPQSGFWLKERWADDGRMWW